MNELGDFLQKRIKQKGWSNREAARQAGISSGAISTILRGVKRPRGETLKTLAEALDLEEARLLHLAGMLDDIPTKNLDQSAAYIARRLTNLPITYREIAIDALAGVLDAVYDLHETHEAQIRDLTLLGSKRLSMGLSGHDKRDEEMFALLSPDDLEALNLLQEDDPQAYEELMFELREAFVRLGRIEEKELLAIFEKYASK